MAFSCCVISSYHYCPNLERQKRNNDLRNNGQFVLLSGLDFHSNRCICGSLIEPDIDFDGRLNDAGSFLRYRAKSNFKAQRRYLHAVDRAAGLICDQTVVLTGFYSRQGFEAPLRRIKFNDPETGKRLV